MRSDKNAVQPREARISHQRRTRWSKTKRIVPEIVFHRVQTAVVTLQSGVDASPRSCGVINLATELRML